MRHLVIAALVAAPLGLFAHDNDRKWKLEERDSIRKTFEISGPGRKLLVDNIHGFVHVSGGSGSQVQVSVEKHIFADSHEAMAEAKRDVKVDMSQQGAFLRLYTDGPFRTNNGTNYRGDDYYNYRVVMDYEVQVPADTEVILKTVTNGDIQLRRTTGDYDIHGLNGGIEMDEVSGSGVISTLNGPVKVTFTKNPGKPTKFHTLNGSMDVYFRPNLNADLKFKKLNGGIYTDFEVTAGPSAGHGGAEGGKFVYRSGGVIGGRTGNGGPELSFETLNGSIRLHSRS